MVPGRRIMIDAGFVVKNSYTGDFLLHILHCLESEDYGFAKAQVEYVCLQIDLHFAQAVLLEADDAIDQLIEDSNIALWARNENLAYASIWKEKIAKSEECRQDFNDFLNWRFHQIEFYFENVDVKRQVIGLAEMSFDEELTLTEDMQFIPLVTDKEMYGRAYFTLLEQLVRPFSISVMKELNYALVEAVIKQLSRLAVCILVDACHTVLRQELLDVYEIQNWNVNCGSELFDLPERLCRRLEERLLSME